MVMVISFPDFFLMDFSFAIRRIMMLEFSQYLENYLWPNYVTLKSSHAHMMSIVIMINEKFRERVPAWQVRLCS
jgi:intron-binding protein aquarius